MDDSSSKDVEKGIAREETEQSEITKVGSDILSRKSTFWSFRRSTRCDSGSCKYPLSVVTVASNDLILRAAGEGQLPSTGWFGWRSIAKKESSEKEAIGDEFPEAEDEKLGTENIVRQR
jgi:hypothetical protein